jgi:hypothetical protein
LADGKTLCPTKSARPLPPEITENHDILRVVAPLKGSLFPQKRKAIAGKKGSSRLTRHELKEQVQHDAFAETVTSILEYSRAHRAQLLRWGLVTVAVLAIVLAGLWYSAHTRAQRQADLAAAFDVLQAPVGPPNQFGKTFPTQDAKRDASVKALTAVINKDAGTAEGYMAQYYRGSLKAQLDPKGAEADLRAVANSASPSAPLAKIALSQLYAGENRIAEAQQLLRSLIDKPTSLVSKAQAQILLAQLDQTANPQEAKKLLQSLRTANQDPAVTRAVGELSASLTK